MDYEAYWLSPAGEIYPVPTKHINFVISNPDIFKLTKKYIEEKYALHKEPMGLEGKAREEIMSALIFQGWIRVRFEKKKYIWKIQSLSLCKEVCEIIDKWHRTLDKYADATVEFLPLYR